jgi:Bacterial PH domain
MAVMEGKQTFRSPVSVVIWWLWVLFAAGNLIDLAVQGRDHLSVVAAFILLLVTGVVYTTAQRPRVVADGDGMTISNPLRDHRVGWAAVAGIDAAELLRIRCEWPPDGGTGKRVLYSWAVQTPRRKLATAQLRAQRPRPGQRAPVGGRGAFGAPVPADAGNQPPDVADSRHMVAALTALAEQGRADAADRPAEPPVSTWYWPAFAVIILPTLALVVAILT